MMPQSQSMSDVVDSENSSYPNCTLRYRDSYLSAQRSNDRTTNHVSFDPCVTEDVSPLQFMARVCINTVIMNQIPSTCYSETLDRCNFTLPHSFDQGRTVLSFDVEKGESALGIRIIGMDAESSGGHGIFIQEIQSGSVADRYTV